MSVMVAVCAVVAALSLVCLVVFHRGAAGLGSAAVAGLAAFADLVATTACLLAAVGYAGQGLFHPGVSAVHALRVAALCFGAQLICMLRGRLATKPRRVPRRVDGWRLPSVASVAVTLLVSDVQVRDGRVAVEAVTRAGRLQVFETGMDADHCRAVVGHQVVGIVEEGSSRLLDLVDLGSCADAPVWRSPVQVPIAPVRGAA